MLEGIDWMNDREWERAAFQRYSDEHARELLLRSYPHFRRVRVTEVIRLEAEPQREKTLG
jgi:hypothetical protein